MTAPRLVRAVASGTDTVILTFDQAMGGDTLLLSDSYSFDGGLRVEGVSPVSGHTEQVRILTNAQVDSRAYRVFVSAAVVNASLEGIDITQASAAFAGLSTVSAYVVQGLVARSDLEGRKINLYWNDPEGAAVRSVVIVRRQKSWAFDVADSDLTVVYNGVPEALGTDPIGGFERTFTDTALRELTYYYYTVVVSSTLAAPLASFPVGPESRTYALSTVSYDSKEWLVRKGLIPRHWFPDDSTFPANYTLDKLLTIFGAWLDLMRSHSKAGLLQGIWKDAPFASLGDLNRSIGFEPEGESYDFDTLRRTLLQMSSIFAVRGRKTSIILAVWSLVEWTADVVEFGLYEHRRVFGTLNPFTRTYSHFGTVGGDAEYGILSEPGIAVPWTADEWIGGRVQDLFGNWFDVLSNTTDTLTLDVGTVDEETVVTTTAIVTGDHQVTLDVIPGLLVGQRVSIRNPANDVVSILAITAVDGPTRTITFWNTTQNSFPIGSVITWRIVAPQLQFLGEVAVGAVNSLEVDLQGGTSAWITDQWKDFIVRDSAGNEHTVTTSDHDTLYFTDGLLIPTGIFQIAKGYVGIDPEGGFELSLGDKPTLYNRLWDRALRGTRFDPFFYLYGGYRGSLTGAWGACDLGVYITTPEAKYSFGRVSSVATTTITDTAADFGVNELVGMYLNPNHNQTKLFKIVSNTIDTITVSGDVTRLARVGQGYVVLTARNAQKYLRLVARIGEFVEDGIHPHILFV